MKAEGFRTLRVLLPGGMPQRVSSGQFPGAEPRVFLREAKPVKLKKVEFSHFFDALNPMLRIGAWGFMDMLKHPGGAFFV